MIKSVLPSVTVFYDVETQTPHPNAMDLIAYKNNVAVAQMRIYSVGGGKIKIESREERESAEKYPHNLLFEIRAYCEARNMRLYDYGYECKSEEIKAYLSEV